jgi:vacuolar-type H+-ATPase catalytic subunit A/Vma1
VIGGLSFGGLDLFLTLRKERKEENKNAINNLRKHTDDLLHILKKWAEEPLTPHTEYLFPFAQQHMNDDEQVRNILRGTDGMNNTESQCNDLQKKIPRYVLDAIEKHACESFPELEPDIMHELRDDIILFHQKQAKKKSYIFAAKLESSTPSDKYALQSERSNGSVRCRYLMADKKNIEALTKTMNDLLVDASLQEMTKTLMTLANRLYKLQSAFKQRIDLIIKETTYAVNEEGKILAGKCEICEAVKNKWHMD